MQPVDRQRLPDALRVLMITDDRGDTDRIEEIVRAALAGGVRAVQVRERALSARAVARLCERLRPDFDSCSALLFVNGHADVAAAGLVHGVHLNARSLSPAQVRRFLPRSVWIGYSAHDPAELTFAADGGADYATLSPVYPSTCKPGADALGMARAIEWTARARLPVLWLGGLDAQRTATLPTNRPFGVAVRSALCDAGDVQSAAVELVAAADRAWHRAPN